ncbi:uncharacterized protein LOC120662934 [Panicum virgatum]|uniref:uncharacterized protein LOC120662934 n=1 Tax=Panicum virgatum TaxID=38727 RepID=UPI0019D5CA47|nr:uncharacterized protein LOC120662934 [Panicum virgatum]
MRLSKVLMDGGSSLNILFVDTLEAMGIPRDCLRESLFPFYGILSGMKQSPTYTKFMAVPNNTYFKLKLSGPNGVITVSGSYEQAYVSSREYYDLATTAANSAELGQLRAATAECRPDPGRPSQAPAFVSTDETKTVVVDDADPTKTVRIGSQLPTK